MDKTTADQIGDEIARIAAGVRQMDESTRRDIGTLRREMAEAKSGTAIAGLTSRLDQLETALHRPHIGGQPVLASAEARAFEGFLRRGAEALGPDERRALSVGTDTAGGFLAPPEFARELEKELGLLSPLRRLVRVVPTGRGTYEIPKRTGKPSGAWVGETEQRPQTQASYGVITVEAHELGAQTIVTTKLLEDAVIDVNVELAADLAESFADAENLAFLLGNGLKKPHGLLLNADIPVQVSGSAAALTPDGMIDALYRLPAPYRANASWLMGGPTLAAVRKFKDTAGNYLWQPSLALGQPERILGYPVYEVPGMPEVAANALPVVVGDFSRLYRITDRREFTVLRDPFTLAGVGQVVFTASRRTGGDVVQPKAGVIVKVSAA